jgi:hypothetical protein
MEYKLCVHQIRVLIINNLHANLNNILGALAKLRKAPIGLRHDCQSVRPNGTTQLPLEGSSLNFISEYFSKICR